MIPIILIFLIIFLVYENVLKKRIEISFITMNDTKCSNRLYNLNNHSNFCESRYCAAKLLLKIIKKINVAEKSIDIAMFNFTNRHLVNSVLEARKRNVNVRLIMDRSMFEGEDNRIIAVNLKAAGEKCKFLFNFFFHCKIGIFLEFKFNSLLHFIKSNFLVPY